MDDYSKFYFESISKLEKMSEKIKIENSNLEEILDKELSIENGYLDSDLDFYDVISAVIFGLAGAILSTNEDIEKFLSQIHNHASGNYKNKSNKLQEFLSNLLRHSKDAIDIPEGHKNFINRDGSNAYGLFHRLFWGHDILSISKDNPFYLMIKSNGIIFGILKAVRHLIADTFSKQGLPLPGSSFFDFKQENGKISNYLLSIVKKAAKEAGNNNLAHEYYRHAFTIRIQDIAAHGLVYASAQGYFYFRNIKDDIRKIQYKILSYSVNFFAHALIGSIRQKGFPYINWASLVMIIKEMYSLFKVSNKETTRMEIETKNIILVNENIIADNKYLKDKVFKTAKSLKSRDSYVDYLDDFILEEQKSFELVDFLEED